MECSRFGANPFHAYLRIGAVADFFDNPSEEEM
jgi:hypothetical protein